MHEAQPLAPADTLPGGAAPNEPVPAHAAQGSEAAALLAREEPVNMAWLALNQLLIRVGWIFKTESIIIPAFLDLIVAGHGMQDVLRGCLPVLNRLGQSVPPLLLAQRLKSLPHKKWVLTGSTAIMAGCFLILSAICFFTDGLGGPWMPGLFLALYGVFFAANGMNQLTLNTLQGKLIRPHRRGRLLALSTALGAPLSILGAWWWLGGWLSEPERGFAFIFGTSGVLFALAALCGPALREPADDYAEERTSAKEQFVAAWEILRSDANFRRLAVVAAAFSIVLMLFPHYQNLGVSQLGLSLGSMVWWVIVQNAGTGLFSLIAGPVADRSGNRLALRLTILFAGATPLLAVIMGHAGELGRDLFWLVFLPVGLTPVAIRVLANYALEICEPRDHAHYVSTLNFCLALPVLLLSPLVGLLIREAGFDFVFLSGGAVILLAGLLTFRMAEPRRSAPIVIAPIDESLE